jgi:RHS repeat-associated protein
VDDLENSDRLGFIGKEVDNENMLGDFGVRKYSSEMGMFTSIDPLWS